MNARNDRYMLLTLDEPPSNIKVGWKEHMTIFTNELKNLKATGLTNINTILKQAFDLLNLNRLSAPKNRKKIKNILSQDFSLRSYFYPFEYIHFIQNQCDQMVQYN